MTGFLVLPICVICINNQHYLESVLGTYNVNFLSASASRSDQLTALQAEKEFDVLIVGGGVTGCGVALDSTLRGTCVIPLYSSKVCVLIFALSPSSPSVPPSLFSPLKVLTQRWWRSTISPQAPAAGAPSSSMEVCVIWRRLSLV